jgi:hypothetical protein
MGFLLAGPILAILGVCVSRDLEISRPRQYIEGKSGICPNTTINVRNAELFLSGPNVLTRNQSHVALNATEQCIG